MGAAVIRLVCVGLLSLGFAGTASAVREENFDFGVTVGARDSAAAQLAQFHGVPPHQHPSVAIIGFSKCGTTTIAHDLTKLFGRDLVNVPVIKEVDILHMECNDTCLSDYQQNKLNARYGKPYTCDVSPVYVWFPDPVMGNLERANPEAGLVLLMRQPLNRVRSAFNYFSRESPERFQGAPHSTVMELLTFELDTVQASPSAMAAIDALLDRSADAAAAADALDILRATLDYASPLVGSMYVGQLLRWRERLVSAVGYTLIVNVDAGYFGKEEAFFKEVLYPFVFGSADAPGITEEERARRREIRERWKPAKQFAPAVYGRECELTPELACRLQRFYAPILERLRELLLDFEAESKGRTFIYPSPADEVWWPETTEYCS